MYGTGFSYASFCRNGFRMCGYVCRSSHRSYIVESPMKRTVHTSRGWSMMEYLRVYIKRMVKLSECNPYLPPLVSASFSSLNDMIRYLTLIKRDSLFFPRSIGGSRYGVFLLQMSNCPARCSTPDHALAAAHQSRADAKPSSQPLHAQSFGRWQVGLSCS